MLWDHDYIDVLLILFVNVKVLLLLDFRIKWIQSFILNQHLLTSQFPLLFIVFIGAARQMPTGTYSNGVMFHHNHPV